MRHAKGPMRSHSLHNDNFGYNVKPKGAVAMYGNAVAKNRPLP